MGGRQGGTKGFGTRGGMGARVGYEIHEAIVDMLAHGWRRSEVARLTGVCYDHVRRVDLILGGVYRPQNSDYDPRFLDREERYELARLTGAGLSVRETARQLRRDPATISRELRRNRDPRTGHYLPEKAHRLAWERQRRPKQSKIARDPLLKAMVQKMLGQAALSRQISGRLKVLFPDNDRMRISLSRSTAASTSTARGAGPRAQGHAAQRRGPSPAPRPTRKQGQPHRGRGQHRRASRGGRGSPGPRSPRRRSDPRQHASPRSAVATIVERTSGYWSWATSARARRRSRLRCGREAMSVYPTELAETLTWDRGTEMANHADLTKRTGIDVYFADPSHLGSAAATKTPTAWSASTSPRAPTERPLRSRPSRNRRGAQQQTPETTRLPHLRRGPG